MSMSAQQLVGFQRLLYAKSSTLRVWQFLLQIAVAVPAAVAVIATEQLTTYILAISGSLLLVIWWVVNSLYLSKRGSAHIARRAAMVVGGLDQPLSPLATASLHDRLGVSVKEAEAYQKQDYFASNLPPGAARLGEMIEESAFYSAPLQRASARIMMAMLAGFSTIAAGIALAGPFLEAGMGLTLSRVILAISVFVMSSDVLGSYFAHRRAADDIEGVRNRMMAMGHGGYLEGDVWLALADYQSAVEGAPEVVPYVYQIKERRLNERWADYQRNRDSVRSVSRDSCHREHPIPQSLDIEKP